MLLFQQHHPEIGSPQGDDLASELGAAPDITTFQDLYTPSIKHEAVQQSAENEEGDIDWRTKQILVDGVTVRFTDNMDHLTMTVEGDLDISIVKTIVTELQQKLARVENAECQTKRLG